MAHSEHHKYYSPDKNGKFLNSNTDNGSKVCLLNEIPSLKKFTTADRQNVSIRPSVFTIKLEIKIHPDSSPSNLLRFKI
jgi:hypothetical protein